MSIKGVKDIKVRYEDRSLDVTFDDAETSTEEIIKKVGDEMGLKLEEGEFAASKEGGVSETCPM